MGFIQQNNLELVGNEFFHGNQVYVMEVLVNCHSGYYDSLTIERTEWVERIARNDRPTKRQKRD